MKLDYKLSRFVQKFLHDFKQGIIDNHELLSTINGLLLPESCVMIHNDEMHLLLFMFHERYMQETMTHIFDVVWVINNIEKTKTPIKDRIGKYSEVFPF